MADLHERRTSAGTGDTIATAAIIGAGFSGLGMAIRLRQAGIDDFIVFEQSDDIGGTWHDNTYPGVACDVPSHLYSYSFEPNAEWTRAYAPQREIHAYLHRCADKYALRPHIRLGTKVVRAVFDEEKGLWEVTDDGGDRYRVRALIAGMGPLSVPSYPDLPGLHEFEGTFFHTARWDHDTSLAGKRVGVIGTGASAIQVVPALAERAAGITVFQRSPPWIVPKPDRQITERERERFRRFPFLMKLLRLRLYWRYEAFAPRIIWTHERLKRGAERMALDHIEQQVADPALRARVTPDYRFGCKRVLFSDDWYPTLQRDDVMLVDRAVERVTPTGVVTADGRAHDLDAIVSATGFRVPLAGAPFEIRGLGGRLLDHEWREGAQAYKGVNVSGFPNLFLLLGPNSNAAHTSILICMEQQAAYILRALRLMKRRRLKYLDVKAPAQARFNERLQRRLARTVWETGGCRNYYLAPNGRNTALYPGFNWEYGLRMRRLRTADYRLVAAGSASGSQTGMPDST
ncbi:K+ transport flavoprotein [Salinisphaera sp. PC39]|uniref:flavin-containing monooxygenase n=1 Tax=Salinisphaera sp. PC39 TaxID=1304156 RepID=UPI003341B8F8